MNKNIIIGIIFIFQVVAVHAQGKLEDPLHSIVIQGIDCIYRQEYEMADSIFRYAAARYPQHPAGYLYQVGVMQQHAIDFGVAIERAKFDSLLELGEKAARDQDSPWREYFLATAYGYDAYESIDRGGLFNGVRKGLSSASKFEEVIEEDSASYDAYVGVGTYYYWSSRQTLSVSWLPFLKDKRQLGISMLIAGAERSVYNRFAAVTSLISIYLDDEKYTDAEKWSRRGLKYYPGNRIFLWGLTAALDRQKRSAEAAIVYETLLKSIIEQKTPNPYGELVGRLFLAKFRLSINDTTMALDHLKKILFYENAVFPADLEARAKAKFTEAQAMSSALNNRKSEHK